MKRIVIFTTLFVLIFYSASFAADDEKYVVFYVESEGATRNEAVEAGWLEGIRTAVGSYIDAKQELNNDQLTERIIAYNRGLVERYEIIGVDNSRAAQGVYKVKQRLWILRDALRDGAKHVTAGSAEISFSPEDVKRRREELNLRDLEAKNAPRRKLQRQNLRLARNYYRPCSTGTSPKISLRATFRESLNP